MPLILDGETSGYDGMAVALGVTNDRKDFLGIDTDGAEDEWVFREMLEGFLEGGLKIGEGLL